MRLAPRSHRRTGTALVAVTAVWFLVVIAIYYERVWEILLAGPGAWAPPELGQSLRHTGLPHAREAAGRALAGVGSALVVALAMLGGGRLVDRWLMPAGLACHERLVIRFSTGAGVLGAILLLMAAAGVYRPGPVRGLVLLLAAIAVVQGARAFRIGRRERRAHAPDATGLVWQGGIWFFVTALAGLVAFLTALAPEVEYDALWYHLELPRRWLEAGRPVDNVHEYVSLYPLTWELLFGAALTFDGAVGARILHWMATMAAAAGAFALSVRALGSRNGWIAAAIFITAPTVLWESSTAYVDGALALHTAVAAGALLRSAAGASDRRWLWLAGIQLGLACATKHLGLVVAASAMIPFAIHTWRHLGFRPMLHHAVIVCLLSVAIPFPWYLRAWMASGNPVFPELYSVFGAAPAERWDDLSERGVAGFKDRFGREGSAGRATLLPWDMTMHGAKYGGTLGPFVLLGVPGLALLLRRRPAPSMLAGAAIYFAIWASPLSSLQLRFLVPWWVMMAPLVAAGLAQVGRAVPLAPAARTAGHVALAAIALANLPPFVPLHERDRDGWNGWLTHVVRRVPVEVVTGGIGADDWLRSEVRSYRAWEFLNLRTPRDARVLTFFGGDHFYAERERLWSESVAARAVTWGASVGHAPGLFDDLDRLGITHVLAPAPRPDRTPPHDRLAILSPAATSRFTAVHEDHWAIVYRVDARSGAYGTSPGADGSSASAARSDQR